MQVNALSEIPLQLSLEIFQRCLTMLAFQHLLTHLPRVLSNCAISRAQVHPVRHASFIPLVTPNAVIYMRIATRIGTRPGSIARRIPRFIPWYRHARARARGTDTLSIFFRIEIRIEYEAG